MEGARWCAFHKGTARVEMQTINQGWWDPGLGDTALGESRRTAGSSTGPTPATGQHLSSEAPEQTLAACSPKGLGSTMCGSPHVAAAGAPEIPRDRRAFAVLQCSGPPAYYGWWLLGHLYSASWVTGEFIPWVFFSVACWDDQLGAAGRFDVRGLLSIGRTKSADALLSSIGGRP